MAGNSEYNLTPPTVLNDKEELYKYLQHLEERIIELEKQLKELKGS